MDGSRSGSFTAVSVPDGYARFMLGRCLSPGQLRARLASKLGDPADGDPAGGVTVRTVSNVARGTK